MPKLNVDDCERFYEGASNKIERICMDCVLDRACCSDTVPVAGAGSGFDFSRKIVYTMEP
jgi:hypothetical protein